MIDFRRLRDLLNRLPDAWQQWQWAANDAAHIGSPIITDMPRSRDVGDPVARAVIKADNMYHAYQQVLNEVQSMRQELQPMIDALEDPTAKALMRLRYMDGFTPGVIEKSSLFNMSRRGIYYKLREAQQVILCRQRGQNG